MTYRIYHEWMLQMLPLLDPWSKKEMFRIATGEEPSRVSWGKVTVYGNQGMEVQPQSITFSIVYYLLEGDRWVRYCM